MEDEIIIIPQQVQKFSSVLQKRKLWMYVLRKENDEGNYERDLGVFLEMNGAIYSVVQ